MGSKIDHRCMYTKDHEWIRKDDAGVYYLIGITDYAQSALGDVVHINPVKAGLRFNKTDSITSIDSVKVAADLFAPVGGEVIEYNTNLNIDHDSPALLNKDPYEAGWIVRIQINDINELKGLLSPEEYVKLVADH